MTSQGSVKMRVWLLIVAVFLLGGVTGASLDRVLMRSGSDRPGAPRGRRGPEGWIADMKRDLNLTADQEKTIRGIFEESRKQFNPRALEAQCPALKESRERTRARIREALTPEQQKIYDQKNAERDAEMQRKSEENQK